MVNDDTTSRDAASDSREMGVDFGRLEAQLPSLDYPITREELLDDYGEYEVETAGGSESLQSILGGQEEATGESDRHEYASADEVHQAILNMVGSDAVGRKGYTDRGGSSRDDVQDGGSSEKTTDESL